MNGQTVAHLPRSHRDPQGTSMKKTMLNIIYFNKFNKNIIMGDKMGLSTSNSIEIHSCLPI